MAGDWIKMRAELHTHPKIVRMSSALKADRLRVVGGLHSAWCLFDVHSTDGFLNGYTPETLDDLIGFPGFARAMIAVGWLEEEGENLVMPRFDVHNGQSAKRRAQDADRKKKSRKMSACDADKKGTREEKRREDIKDLNPERERAGGSHSGDDISGNSPPLPPIPPKPQEEDFGAGMDFGPLGKFPITEDWKPSTDFVGKARLWGQNLGAEPGYTPEELQQFRDYWAPDGKVKHQQAWEQTFATSLLQSRGRSQKSSPAGRDVNRISEPDKTIPTGFRG
ncbi:Pyocin large subunit [Citrobacter werkmanii]|nr:DnaT-like ssDNA-binding domain-containing protein [Citrobacter werkmanii]ATF52056.1 Pyocin large subunit [Citrobacter werkmanii]